MRDLYNEVLYDFQKKATDSATGKDRFALWMEPGTGKTFTSLSIFQRSKLPKLVVICQNSKKVDWEEDVGLNLGIETRVLGNGKDKDNKILAEWNSGALVVNYETAWRREIPFDSDTFLIIDESQYLKSHKSKIGKWGVSASRQVGKLLLLSGTPSSDNYGFFNQLTMLGMTMKHKDFRDMFCLTELVQYPGVRFSSIKVTGDKNTDYLFEQMKAISFKIKTEEALELPDEVFTDIRLTHDKKKDYDKIMKTSTYKDVEIPSPGVLFLRLAQMSSGFVESYTDLSNHKKEALKDLLESNENNFVIFYKFKQELKDIKAICKELGIMVFECNGDTKNDMEAKHYQGRCVIASQYQSGATGKNWQFMNNMIYYSPTWSVEEYVQSKARILRNGQTKKCFYYRFITRGTVETKIYNTLEQGKDYTMSIFQSEKN